MHLDLADDPFRTRAEAWLRSLDDEAIADLTTLLHLSPGYYPTTLLALREAELTRRQVRGRSNHRYAGPRPDNGLPVSHPSDYDWRFTSTTADLLVQRAVADSSYGSRVLHLGAPSTFIAGARHAPTHSHILLDGNEAVARRIGEGASALSGAVICLDLTEGGWPRLGAASVILDPPWYRDYTLLFLIAASDASVTGATILLCQPTEASRPNVEREREALLDELPKLGFELVEHVQQVLQYQTPHFEHMSLRKLLPMLSIPDDWRVGDLLILRKTSERCGDHQPTVHAERWCEVGVGPVRIKLRASGASVDMQPLVSGDILDTVSRRDGVRSRIGMWTSGNRVYGIANPDRVRRLLEACQSDWSQGRLDAGSTAVQGHRLGVDEMAARHLHSVLEVELAEHSAEKRGAR